VNTPYFLVRTPTHVVYNIILQRNYISVDIYTRTEYFPRNRNNTWEKHRTDQ